MPGNFCLNRTSGGQGTLKFLQIIYTIFLSTSSVTHRGHVQYFLYKNNKSNIEWIGKIMLNPYHGVTGYTLRQLKVRVGFIVAYTGDPAGRSSFYCRTVIILCNNHTPITCAVMKVMANNARQQKRKLQWTIHCFTIATCTRVAINPPLKSRRRHNICSIGLM
jgi:hypothetical protein